MPRLLAHIGWRGLRVALTVLAVTGAAALATGPSAAALECEGIALHDGCLFTITGGDTPDPHDGFAVTNTADVPLWEFVRERDLQAIGYPISQRWLDGPFTLQAFQKVILQWDPGKQRMNYFNTLDVLANRYPEAALPNVPPHQVLEADRGADFATITQNHLALLEANTAIKARFLSEPDWLNLYGLPIRYEEREVNGNPQGLQMLRAQRTVFVIWNVPAPGTTVGRVNLQNVPDKVKRLSNVIIPDAAEAPVREDRVAELPLFTLPALGLISDRAALAALFDATDGPNWRNNRNWLSNTPLQEWQGVTTDDNGRVTALHLAGNRLRGKLPPELGGLEALTQLNLQNNQIGGAIPPALGKLASLRGLDLESNQLSGTIPSELGRLTDLETLDLSWNRLTGQIPPELNGLAKLEWLWLRGNQLSGCVPEGLHEILHNDLSDLALPDCGDFDHVPADLPTAIAERAALVALYRATDGENWTNNANWLSGSPVTAWHGVTTDRGVITQIDLADNGLRGELPPELGHLESLVVLSLGDNQLHGAIPAELGRLEDLLSLDLNNNQLTGAIPAELGDLGNLTWLRLDGNQLNGMVPPEMGRLSNLTHLYLEGNQLYGAIPPELGNLARLIKLELAENHLTGEIPPELGRLTELRELHLNGNWLTGAIPPELGNLAWLADLWLNENQLSGMVPAELGRLASLKQLRLGNNQLTGTIPPELGRLANLTHLQLESNRLRGQIPPDLGNLTKLFVLRLDENQLRGAIPPELGRLVSVQLLWLNKNQLGGEIPPELGDLVNLRWLLVGGGNRFTGCIPWKLGFIPTSDIDILGIRFCRAP